MLLLFTAAINTLLKDNSQISKLDDPFLTHHSSQEKAEVVMKNNKEHIMTSS